MAMSCIAASPTARCSSAPTTTSPNKLNPERLLELHRRAFVQIQLLAAIDAQRVFELAETLEPTPEWLHLADGEERIREQLESYCRRYPEGADFLREALD